MKQQLNRLLNSLLMFILALTFLSCSNANTDSILKPEILFRSPALDFTKVSAVAIMPVNNYESEVPEISGAINDGLPIELKSAQKAWKVISYDEILRKMNEKGWGRGYQNYVADLNTYVQAAGGTPNFTAETFKFFEDLKNEMKFEALLFTSYGFSEQAGFKNILGLNIPTTIKRLSVTVVLYELSSRRAWWLARLSIQGNDINNEEMVRTVTQGISQNFGKGTLRQL